MVQRKNYAKVLKMLWIGSKRSSKSFWNGSCIKDTGRYTEIMPHMSRFWCGGEVELWILGKPLWLHFRNGHGWAQKTFELSRAAKEDSKTWSLSIDIWYFLMVIKPRSGLVGGQMGSSDWRVHLVPKQGQRFQRVYGQGARHGIDECRVAALGSWETLHMLQVLGCLLFDRS